MKPTSSTAQDLHSEVEGVVVLHWYDTEVASLHQPSQPACYWSPAHHPHIKHLPANSQQKYPLHCVADG